MPSETTERTVYFNRFDVIMNPVTGDVRFMFRDERAQLDQTTGTTGTPEIVNACEFVITMELAKLLASEMSRLIDGIEKDKQSKKTDEKTLEHSHVRENKV